MTPEEIARHLEPYAGSVDLAVCEQLRVYLELLLKWNARTNLTAIREPVEIVRRHFGESLFVAKHLGKCATLLDFGSGAGFPGIPIQLARPEVQVTLAESQGKKAAFLREAVRALGLRAEVWSARVESMASDAKFDVVTMRAVDRMQLAVEEAVVRAKDSVIIVGGGGVDYKDLRGFTRETIALPGLEEGVLLIARR